MSNKIDIKEAFEFIEEKRKKDAEYLEKQEALKRHKIDTDFEKLNKSKDELAALDNVDFFAERPETREKLIKENQEYFVAAKESFEFMNNILEFNEIIPCFRKNLIVIGAPTGVGKSTCAANIALSAIRQGKHPLIITNEELANDVYNRVTALIHGLHYANHDQIKPEEQAIYLEYQNKLFDKMTVIDNNTHGTNLTTSVEGLQSILNKLRTTEKKFDIIIIDYFQKITGSVAQNKTPVQVLKEVCDILDNFKNEYPAPIVVFAQMRKPTENDDGGYEYRIKWCKDLAVPATCFVELVKDGRNRKTDWLIHKSRFSQYSDLQLCTGWDKGRYVPYDDAFKNQVIKEKTDRELKRVTEKNNQS